MPLIEQIEITHVLPCLADPEKIRFHAQVSGDLTEALPYLNTVLKGAIYNPAVPALTFNRGERIVCLRGRLITCAKADDTEDARAVCDYVLDLINQTWERRGEITPCREQRNRLTPIDIYKLLPRTNCRQCGLPTCLAFAAGVAAYQRNIMQCGPLFTPEWEEHRRLLCQILADAGHEVPAGFAS